MRKLLAFSLAIVLLIACQTELKHQINSGNQVYLDDENCLVDLRFPIITGLEDSLTASGLNQYFYTALHLERYARHCLQDSNLERQVVLGDYLIHTHTDTLISIELIRAVKSASDAKPTRSYYPVTVKLPEIFNPPLDLYFGAGIYEKLLPKLESWAQGDSLRFFNELAFKPGTHYAIPYCLSADSLILYPGAEGEFTALSRLPIALSEL